MMIALAFSMLAASAQPGCGPDAMAAVNRAAVLAAEFDLAGASAELEAGNIAGCETAQVAIRYARGLMAAQEAFRQGGSFESLAPVRQAIAGLDAISKGRPGAAAVARLVLQAASAAAQSELDEMRLYLESAIQMESLQRAARQRRRDSGGAVVAAAPLRRCSSRVCRGTCADGRHRAGARWHGTCGSTAAGHGHCLCGIS
jgi:hypothetical protein